MTEATPGATAPPTPAAGMPSVNALSRPLVERLLQDADRLRLGVQRDASGVRIVDAGIAVAGGTEAGLRIGEICMGGLGRVRLQSAVQTGADDAGPGGWPTWVQVSSSQPVLACLGSQYAGWSLAATKEEAGGKKFFALGSGPARALAAKEPLFAELGYRDRVESGSRGNVALPLSSFPSGDGRRTAASLGRADLAGAAVLVLEVDRAPPPVVVEKVLHDCGLRAEQLTLILTPTRSAAGTAQVVSRVLEVALHKAHELGFALADVVDGSAVAPLPSPSPDGVQAMGRTNDAILYGGRVHLSVRGDDAAARSLAQRLPSRNSADYGASFADIFQRAGFDFYKIDGALFAPAEVWVSNLDSGNTWHGGALNLALLRQLWLQEA